MFGEILHFVQDDEVYREILHFVQDDDVMLSGAKHLHDDALRRPSDDITPK